jgi:succinoglycan biosynthesis protein ExoL
LGHINSAPQPRVAALPAVDRSRVVYVAPDCTDSAVQRRVRSFQRVGADVVSFSFRRVRYNREFVPDWPNVELGLTTERKLVSRAIVFLQALRCIFRDRRIWRSASLVCARNLDLAILALVGKAVTRCPAPLVYEVLDIHPSMSRRGLRGKLSRWVERRVLARSQHVVVSSPAFLREYFRPLQRYTGPCLLLENKWPIEELTSFKRQLVCEVERQPDMWTIGWFGNIRCQRSLEILTELADALPDRVRICIRGYASLLGEDKLQQVIRNRPNMVFEGEYVAPQDLAEVYSDVHFNWCVDLDGCENSLWLLPNRLYEGGYFGVPALAVADHETGRVVRQRGLGLSLENPLGESLRNLFLNMDGDTYQRLRERTESLPLSLFVDDGEIATLLPLPRTDQRADSQPDGLLAATLSASQQEQTP